MLSRESLVLQYQAQQAAKPVEGDDEENGKLGMSQMSKCLFGQGVVGEKSTTVHGCNFMFY